MRRFGLLLGLGVGFVVVSAPYLLAQSDNSSSQDAGPFDIRVETREVVVPVYVAHRGVSISPMRNLKGKVVGQTASIDAEISGPAAKDFHVFEDGVEQPIENLRFEVMRTAWVPDNLGQHVEYSGTPKGIWAAPEGWVLGVSPGALGKIVWGCGFHYYRVAYVPPSSVEGSCHQIKVKVDRPNTTVLSRTEYCNTEHSPSDPLKGTKIAEQMAEEVVSAQEAKLPLWVQAVTTLNHGDTGMVNIAAEFPWRALSTRMNGCYLEANVDLLGLVYNKDGTLAERFSDAAAWQNPLQSHVPDVTLPWGVSTCAGNAGQENISLAEQEPYSHLFSRYETQIELRPGTYNLRIVVTDGKKFGRTDVPLTVASYDRNSLAVSGIVLCKRFTNIAAAWLQHSHDYLRFVDRPQDDIYPRGETSMAPEYVPLVSNGIGVTPAGDTRFHKDGPVHKGDDLISYFELYEPLLATGPAKVQFQVRVIDSTSGQVELDSGLRSADSYAPSGSLIPIGWELPLKKLAKGSYRVEVQASDSMGKQTAWRAASFTVE
jgi:hypothetical protein